MAIQSASLQSSSVRNQAQEFKNIVQEFAKRKDVSENGTIIKQSLETFESSLLSTETSVRLISTDYRGTSLKAFALR